MVFKYCLNRLLIGSNARSTEPETAQAEQKRTDQRQPRSSLPEELRLRSERFCVSAERTAAASEAIQADNNFLTGRHEIQVYRVKQQ